MKDDERKLWIERQIMLYKTTKRWKILELITSVQAIGTYGKL